ncbi:RHS repeat-associated core domain-containing protein [Paenibacillus sp. PK3_47]|uniref:RHS repeat-associated core domain-containing protein n=1 Tax=Paenibacillus sp. PK3_47 TaxID=2072642 RepID=UPI00201DC699|nr:RHS repeat-associated core domain-containing protein [Paenibacillus sp. PK3_47]
MLNYKGKDKRFRFDPDGIFINGDEKSRYYLEYSDGKREYFNDNKLIGIVDRFGNTITYKYKSSSYYSQIESITDSLGREIRVSYEEDNLTGSTNFNGENVYIQAFDGERLLEKVTLKKDRVKTTVNELKTYSPFLSSITHHGETSAQDESIFLEYDFRFGKYNPHSAYYGEQDYNLFGLIKQIRYPHSTTNYQFNLVTRHIGYYETMEEYQVSARSDQTASTFYNQATYSYIGNYTGTRLEDYPGVIPESNRYSSTITIKSTTKDNGKQIINSFDGKGRLLSTDVLAANGERIVNKYSEFHPVFIYSPTRTISYEYAAGDSEATANQQITETSYDDWGRVASQTKPMPLEQFNNLSLRQHFTTTYTYEPEFQFLQSKSWYQNENDPVPLTEHYTYTEQGRPATVINAKNELTSYTYGYIDGLGKIERITAETRANNGLVAKSVIRYGSENGYAYPTEEKQYFNIGKDTEKNVKVTMAYDKGNGQLLSKTIGDNHTVSYKYDAFGRLEKETYPEKTNANGERYSEVVDYHYYHQTSSNFDAVNAGTYVLKVDSIRTLTNLANNKTTKTYANVLYNGLGLALLEEHYDPNSGKWEFTQYHYDDLGRPIYQKDALGNEITASYDAWGRQNRGTTANNDIIISDYDLKSRTSTSYLQDKNTGEALNYVQESFDPWGNKLSASTYKDWPANQQRITESYRYNIIGQVTGYTDPNGNVNENGITTSYAYDALGRLNAVKDALNQTTNYLYDGNGQLSQITIQAKGGTPQTLNTKTYNELGLLSVKQDAASQSESYTYNNLGQLERKTDRNGSSLAYTYDEMGQLKTSTIQGVVNNVAQSQETRMIFGDMDPSKQTIQTLTNGVLTATQTQTLNELGQVRETYSVSGSHHARIGNELDSLGRITEISDTYMGFFTQYQYKKERLEKVQTDGSSILNGDPSVNALYSYTANNLVNTIEYPTLTDGSKLISKYTYNKALGWTETLTNTKGGVALSSYSYGYDNNGNRTSVSESRNGSAAQTTHYLYDGLNRLETITRPDGSQTKYTYDVRGNRQTVSDTSSLNFDSMDTSYTYDLQNTLTSVTKGGSATSFKYYADGMRFMKTNGNTQTQVNYNFQGQVISEEKIVNGVFVEQANFVRGDRVLVKKDKKASKDYYYLYNGHGDVVQIVNTSGAVVNNYTYDEWGNITSQVEGTSNSFKYTGEVYDAETGLYYLRARYYDPSMGRFLNEDTYEGQIDNPLSLNLYTYVHNNPLIYSDPTGHAAMAAGIYLVPGVGEVALVVTGVAATGYGIYKLYRWATSDKPLSDKEIINNELSKTQKDQIDNIEKNLKAVNNKKHLEAYEKELKDGFLYDKNGNVKLNPKTGKPWNHIKEVEQSEAKIEKMIDKLKNAQKSKPFIENTSEVTKKAVQDAINKGQKFLNEVKKIRNSVKP